MMSHSKSTPRTPLRLLRSAATRSRGGFTLVELLVVVAILGILMALLSGAIVKSVNNARIRRREAECRSLEVGIVNYRHDYNRWPHNEGEQQGGSRFNPEYTSQNWRVFDRLASGNRARHANPLGKAYLDEAALMTTTGPDGAGTRIPLSRRRASGFVDRCTLVDFNGKPYRVRFDLRLDGVTVQPTN